MVKVIKKSEENAAFHTILKELEMLDSPYLVRYLKYYENENEYKVCELAVCYRIDRNGEL